MPKQNLDFFPSCHRVKAEKKDDEIAASTLGTTLGSTPGPCRWVFHSCHPAQGSHQVKASINGHLDVLTMNEAVLAKHRPR
jgi:hypothetical protein